MDPIQNNAYQETENKSDLNDLNDKNKTIPTKTSISNFIEKEKTLWYTVGGFLGGTLLIILFLFDNCRIIAFFLLLGVASLSIGGLLGFLFGIPRASEFGNIRPITDVENNENADNLAGIRNYKPSNSLEQVSDWLTKIIIGIGLVQFNELENRLALLGSNVARWLPESGAIVPQILVVTFAAIGFFAGYTWTRLYYGGMQASADDSLIKRMTNALQKVEKGQKEIGKAVSDQKQETDEINKKAEELEQVTSLLAQGKVLSRQTSEDINFESRGSSLAGDQIPVFADENLNRKVNKFSEAAIDFETDPALEIFGRLKQENEHRKLEVKIVKRFKAGGLLLNATINSLSEVNPFKGDVHFLLHPTYPKRIVTVPVKESKADINFFAMGWFTLVVIADEGKTLLSYSLNKLPDAPETFLNN